MSEVAELIREAEVFIARNDPDSYRVKLVRRLAAALAKTELEAKQTGEPA